MSYHLKSEHGIETKDEKKTQKRLEGLLDPNMQVQDERKKKCLFARRTVLWLCKDLLPFSLVNGQGFRDWMLNNNFVERVDQIPSNVTLSNSALDDVYSLIEGKFKDCVKDSPKIIFITVDMWTSSSGNIPYITVCSRYMDKSFSLKSFTLATEKLQRPHTGERIADFIDSKLHNLNLGHKKSILCGDHGKNIVKSQEKLTNCICYINCLAHAIHLVLTKDLIECQGWNKLKNIFAKIKKTHGALVYNLHTLKEYHLKCQKQEILDYINSVEQIAQDVEADEGSSPFSDSDELTELIQKEYSIISAGMENFSAFAKPNSTRWFSTLNMINTYDKNFGKYHKLYTKLVIFTVFNILDAIDQLLTQTKNLNLKMNDEEFKLLQEMKVLFNIFHDALQILQTDSEPTSMMVVPFHLTILNE